jgi:TolB protein
VRVGTRVTAAFAAGIALAVSASACGGSDSPRPDLVLVSTRDGDYALYELDADGERQRRLTDGETSSSGEESLFFQVDPAWSPDGSLIAFSSRRESSFDLYTMRADGTGTRRLTSATEDDGHPTWSPDGKSIAFARGTPGRIYVMNADGTGVRRLTEDFAEEADPAWSPDGRWIAYTQRTPGTTVRELWVSRADGSDRHRVTNFGRAIFGPAWSPDSKRIAFAADLERTTYDIYSVDLQGNDRRRYTQTLSDSFEPAWSPDGGTIAFSREGAIEAVDQDGSIEVITNREDNDSSPAWNPVVADEGEEES